MAGDCLQCDRAWHRFGRAHALLGPLLDTPLPVVLTSPMCDRLLWCSVRTGSGSRRLTYIHKTSFISGTAWRMNGKHKLSDGPVNALSAELWMKLNGEVQGLQFWFFVLWKFVRKTLKPLVCFNRSMGNTYHRVGLTESYLAIPKHWVSLSWSGSSFGSKFWASGIARTGQTLYNNQF